jgi:hypothetical protein
MDEAVLPEPVGEAGPARAARLAAERTVAGDRRVHRLCRREELGISEGLAGFLIDHAPQVPARLFRGPPGVETGLRDLAAVMVRCEAAVLELADVRSGCIRPQPLPLLRFAHRANGFLGGERTAVFAEGFHAQLVHLGRVAQFAGNDRPVPAQDFRDMAERFTLDRLAARLDQVQQRLRRFRVDRPDRTLAGNVVAAARRAFAIAAAEMLAARASASPRQSRSP